MVLRGPLRGVALAAAAVVGLAACGGSDDGASAADGPASLVATTTIWADITSHIACGEHVDSIVPAGADPHSFEPSLRDRERLNSSDLIVANGAGLEAGLVDLVDSAAHDGVPVVTIADHVDVVAGDPHVWQDPQRVIAAIDPIEAALVAAGRDNGQIAACAEQYRSELKALDTDIAAMVAEVPADRRVMVTNHDAFGYFAQRYGFEIVGTVIPSMSTLGESSAGQLAELADKIEHYQVPAIFAERLGSSHDAQALADRLGVRVVELDSDALESKGEGATYEGMMRRNAAAITDALR